MNKALIVPICMLLLGGGSAYVILRPLMPIFLEEPKELGAIDLERISTGESLQDSSTSSLSTYINITDAFQSASDIYAFADQLDDTASLEAFIAELTQLRRTARSDEVLEVLMLKYAQLDLDRAVSFVMHQEIPLPIIEEFLRTLSGEHFDSVLSALEQHPDKDFVRAIAVALVGVGNPSFERLRILSSLLGNHGRDGFIADALILWASSDPNGALSLALDSGDYVLRQVVTRRIVEEWVRRSPDDAIAHIRSLENLAVSERNNLHVAAIVEWTNTDPDGALDYLISEEGQRLFLLRCSCTASILARLAIQRPEEMFALADTLPEAIAKQWRMAAAQEIASRDIQFALRRLNSSPEMGERRLWLEALAEVYSRLDTPSALDWAKNNSSTPGLVDLVLFHVANLDITSAINFSIENPNIAPPIATFLRPRDLFSIDSVELEALAEKIANAEVSQEEALAVVSSVWIQADPVLAMEWIRVRRPEDMEVYARRFAQSLSRMDLELSQDMIASAPAQVRGELIIEVTGELLRLNPSRAISWFSSYQNERDYDAWVSAIALNAVFEPLSEIAPSDVADLLLMARNPNPDVTSQVARAWAAQDPGAAARWALELRDANARDVAVSATAAQWAVIDQNAVTRWALALPRNGTRDSALDGVLYASISESGYIDPEVVQAFSSDSALRTGIGNAAGAFRKLATRDPARAKDLVSRYVEDSELSRQLNEVIDLAAMQP